MRAAWEIRLRHACLCWRCCLVVMIFQHVISVVALSVSLVDIFVLCHRLACMCSRLYFVCVFKCNNMYKYVNLRKLAYVQVRQCVHASVFLCGCYCSYSVVQHVAVNVLCWMSSLLLYLVMGLQITFLSISVLCLVFKNMFTSCIVCFKSSFKAMYLLKYSLIYFNI